jgi:hypothetical protein
MIILLNKLQSKSGSLIQMQLEKIRLKPYQKAAKESI